jgi:pyruvate/2-oxoacid:ferredoxin oxidoreductase beta subunit
MSQEVKLEEKVTEIDLEEMPEHPYDPLLRVERIPHVWCPGCGIGTAMSSFIMALNRSEISQDKVSVVSGIGCTGRVAGYVNLDSFHTTHGRAVPFASGLKLARPDLKVVVFSGDGAAASGAVYVARWTTLHFKRLEKAIYEALNHRGFTFVEIISPCPTVFGRRNKMGDGVRMLQQFGDRCEIIHGADTADVDIALTGKIIVGKFVEKEKPPFPASSGSNDNKTKGDAE